MDALHEALLVAGEFDEDRSTSQLVFCRLIYVKCMHAYDAL